MCIICVDLISIFIILYLTLTNHSGRDSSYNSVRRYIFCDYST